MSLDTDVEIEETEKEYKERIEKAKKVAFRLFPKLGPGERVGAIEIKRRFRKIRDAGYYVKPYSNMNIDEAWKYLQQLKRELKAASVRPAYFDR